MSRRALLAIGLLGCADSPVAHRPFPQVTDHGAGELDPMRLVTIVAANEDPTIATELFGFGDALVQSDWYTTTGADYGLGAAAGSVHITGAAIAAGTVMDDAALDSYITSAQPPAGDGHTMYMVYLPAGAIEEWEGVPNPDCTAPSAYHRAFGAGGDAMGVSERCMSKLNTADAATMIGSHEIEEAAVDTGRRGWFLQLPEATPPWQFSVWAEDEGTGRVETADLCEGTLIREGAFVYQRIFSNSAAARGGDPCVPALPIPYYNTTTSDDWIEAQPGTTLPITVTGWSTGRTDDWVVTSLPIASSDPALAFGSQTTGNSAISVNNRTYHTINDGKQVVVNVTVPPDAPSGAWAVIALYSFRFGDGGVRPPPGEDLDHRQLVGVYVP
jgi:hypothetical protein